MRMPNGEDAKQVRMPNERGCQASENAKQARMTSGEDGKRARIASEGIKGVKITNLSI